MKKMVYYVIFIWHDGRAQTVHQFDNKKEAQKYASHKQKKFGHLGFDAIVKGFKVVALS